MTTKPNEPDALIERAARHVLDNSRKGNASLNEHQRAADDEKLMTSYRDIIGKALSFIAAHPVADAGGVTDADREAAAKCVEHGLSRPNPLNVRQGVVDSWHLVQAFARHRLQSVAAATAAKDAAIRAVLDSHHPGVAYRQPCGNFAMSCQCDEIIWGVDIPACRAEWRNHVAALSEAREAGAKD